MIDSIIFFGTDSKVGDRTVALADLKSDPVVRKFINRTDDGDDFSPAQITRIRVITKPATYDTNGNQLTPEEVLPGFGILVATDDAADADALWNLPNNICRVQLDRTTGKVIRNRVTLAALRTLNIEPMFMGANYDFKTITK